MESKLVRLLEEEQEKIMVELRRVAPNAVYQLNAEGHTAQQLMGNIGGIKIAIAIIKQFKPRTNMNKEDIELIEMIIQALVSCNDISHDEKQRLFDKLNALKTDKSNKLKNKDENNSIKTIS